MQDWFDVVKLISKNCCLNRIRKKNYMVISKYALKTFDKVNFFNNYIKFLNICIDHAITVVPFPPFTPLHPAPVSYTHLTLPTSNNLCRSRWSPYH